MGNGAFWLSGGNLPFAIAGGLVLVFILFEVIALLLGGSLSGLFHGGADVDHDVDVDAPALEWLGFGMIPAVATGVLMLGLFSMSGYAIQATVHNAGRPLFAPVVASALALIPTFLLSGRIAKFLGRTLFKDESDAVSADELIGGTATITLGETFAGHPTQAKIVDRYRTTHYVLVEPLQPDERFASGENVTLVRRDGARYLVVGEGSDALFETLSQ